MYDAYKNTEQFAGCKHTGKRKYICNERDKGTDTGYKAIKICHNKSNAYKNRNRDTAFKAIK